MQSSVNVAVRVRGNRKQLRGVTNEYGPRDQFGTGPLSPTLNQPPLTQVPMVTAWDPVPQHLSPILPINTLIDRLPVWTYRWEHLLPYVHVHMRPHARWLFECTRRTRCQNRLGCCRSAWQLKHFIISQAGPRREGVVPKHPRRNIFTASGEGEQGRCPKTSLMK